MSNVSPRSSAPSSWGNLCACSQTCTQISAGSRRESSLAKKKPIPQQQNGSFSVSSLSSRVVWSRLRQTLYQANESAKSPSPSLAGQSVIVNQAGLLAPVHRSFASSRGFPSDCQLALACEFAPCYSGVTAPAYEIILSLPDSL